MLVRKGLLTNEEVLAEVKVVRRELEAKRGRYVIRDWNPRPADYELSLGPT